jgi:hypothetical protein
MNNMKPRFYKVENEPGLVRDAESNGIIHVDDATYKAYKLARDLEKQKKLKEEMLNNRINNLENDISEIKSLLKELISKH